MNRAASPTAKTIAPETALHELARKGEREARLISTAAASPPTEVLCKKAQHFVYFLCGLVRKINEHPKVKGSPVTERRQAAQLSCMQANACTLAVRGG